MDPRSYAAVIVFFTLLSVSFPALAQQDVNSQENQQLMTPVPAPGAPATDRSAAFVNQLNLKTYEAAAGDLSMCAQDAVCLKHAKDIKAWVCVASVCDGTDKSRRPIDCFEGASDKYATETQEKINSLACPVIESPSTETRQALLGVVSDVQEGEGWLVQDGAYLLALKKSAESCEDYIKSYVGAYGPKWNFYWYRAMSGCRILAGESTRQQEEKDFSTWFGVVQGVGKCSDITNSEMVSACSAPAAASPVPSPNQSTAQAQ